MTANIYVTVFLELLTVLLECLDVPQLDAVKCASASLYWCSKHLAILYVLTPDT